MLSPTCFLLFAEFGTSQIRLEDCCDKYLNHTLPQAKRKAGLHELPIPVYKATKSQKSGYLVDIRELADYLDKQLESAKKGFQNVNSDFRAAS